MKRLLSILALVSCTTQLAFSQVKGQLAALEDIGEGSVFQRYLGYSDDGEKYTWEAMDKCDLKFINNVNNKFSIFQLNKHEGENMLINCGFGYIKPDHYTEPSMFYSKDHGLAYIYIDGLLYCLKKIKNPSNINNIEYDAVFVLREPKKGEHLSGKAAVKELKNRDHAAVIKKYLSEMKAVQENATANFTDEIKAEIAAVDNKDAATKAENKAKNDAFWQSEQGQKVLAEWGDDNKSPSKVTITNTGKGILTIMYDNGYTHRINGGSKSQFSCNENIYYAVKDASGNHTKKGQLISRAGSNCGKTVAAAGGN